eukprot:scaffold20644_cov129-Isochrysis_galbana.AAC.2
MPLCTCATLCLALSLPAAAGHCDPTSSAMPDPKEKEDARDSRLSGPKRLDVRLPPHGAWLHYLAHPHHLLRCCRNVLPRVIANGIRRRPWKCAKLRPPLMLSVERDVRSRYPSSAAPS